jgi:hypothetical protein
MAKKLSGREAIEAVLAKVAKANKLSTTRAVPHGASKSGVGAFQVLKDGAVMISVRDHDVVVYVDPKTLKAGRPGPKGWENVAHFNHNTPLNIFEKAFNTALKSKRSVIKRASTPKDIASQRKALEARLTELKKQEALLKKPKTKVVKKKPVITNKEKKAIADVAAIKAMNLING